MRIGGPARSRRHPVDLRQPIGRGVVALEALLPTLGVPVVIEA